MPLSLCILTFINAWCLTLFFVLAFGIQKETNASALDYAAAPAAFPWKKKLWLNTWISLGITLLIAIISKSGIVTFHDF